MNTKIDVFLNKKCKEHAIKICSKYDPELFDICISSKYNSCIHKRCFDKAVDECNPHYSELMGMCIDRRYIECVQWNPKKID